MSLAPPIGGWKGSCVRVGVSCCILAVDDKTAAKCFAPDVLLLVKKDVYTVLFGIIELRTFFTQNA